MGTNDHLPNKSQRTARRRRGEPAILLAWTEEAVTEVQPFITQVSTLGGYVGLGRNSKGDCLLLYIKLDDWVERVPVESYAELGDTVADLLAELGS
jgi:hypothetical protein